MRDPNQESETRDGLDSGLQKVVSKSPVTSVQSWGNRWGPTNSGDYPRWMVLTSPEGSLKELRPNSSQAYMINRTPGVFSDDDPQKRVYLWVNEIIIGWHMDYAEAQTAMGKSFYPRHYKYSDAVVRGQVANQNHYDEIVKEVLNFKRASLVGEASVIRFVLPEFVVHRRSDASAKWTSSDNPQNKDRRIVYKNLTFDGYLTGMSAGHRRHVFNPDFELKFAVASYQNENALVSHAGPEADSINAIYEEYEKSLDEKNWSGTSPSDIIGESGYLVGGPDSPSWWVKNKKKN